MRKFKLLFMTALALFMGGSSANAQVDVTDSYVGDLSRIIQGAAHTCGNNHKLSNAGGWQGEGYFNTQTLSGWHNFIVNTNDNLSNGVESWTGGAGSEGFMLGRVTVLPQGSYTLKFTAKAEAPEGTFVPEKTVLKCGDQEQLFDSDNATLREYTFNIEVTTANTPYEFGIYQKEGGTANWARMGAISLILNSTNIEPVANNSVKSFNYDGDQEWHTNTWSTEGNTDGTRFITPFHELWTENGGKLNNAQIVGTYTPKETGVYKVSAWVRAVNESGGAVTGAKIFVADVETDACTGSPVMNGNGRLGTYTAMADGVEGTAFNYGFEIENAQINWIAFKNVTITYLGDLPQEEIDALMAQVPTGKMNAEVKKTLDEYVSALNSEKSVANYNALSLYLPTAQASVEAYATALVAITRAESIIAETNVFVEKDKTAYESAINKYKTAYEEGTMTDADANALEVNLNGGTDHKHQGDPMRPFYSSAWKATNEVSVYTNNWSTEVNNDKFSVPFVEDWLSNTKLANTTISASVEGLQSGTYKVTAKVRMRNYENKDNVSVSGVSLQVSQGDAVAIGGDVNDQVNGQNFHLENVEATGYVTEDGGTLDINFIVKETNASWLLIKAVNYERTGDVPLADADDYAALNTAIAKTNDYVPGFEEGEYAPYNNVKAVKALAAAKAVDQNAKNLKDVINSITETLNAAEWTANKTEENAIYDGSFASEYSRDGRVQPIAWVGTDGHNNADDVRLMWDNTNNPGLNRTTTGQALFTKFGAFYGKEEGYTMPLKANSVYKLTFVYGGWGDKPGDCSKDGYVTITDSNGGTIEITPSRLPLDEISGHSKTEYWKEYEAYFTTGDAGNYVLGLRKDREASNEQSQYVYGDFMLVKTADVVTIDETKEYTPAASNYPANVTLKRSFSAENWNTFVVPFAIDNATLTEKFGTDVEVAQFSEAASEDNAANSVVSFNKMETPAVEANTPVLLKTTTTGDVTFEGVTIETGEAKVDGKANFDFVGTYVAETEIAEGDYYLKNNTIYRSTGIGSYVNGTRAYIKAKNAEARIGSFFIDGEETTNIEGISLKQAEQNGKIYNLNGQEVKTALKGLYIQNGKKVVK